MAALKSGNKCSFLRIKNIKDGVVSTFCKKSAFSSVKLAFFFILGMLTYFSRPARSNDRDYINFINQSGCWSHVGRQGGRQDISLASSGCLSRRTIKHEIFHSLGYYHEQSRPDRNLSIKINLANVIRGKERNFHFKQNTENFGVPYDGRSIMQYGYTAFSKNGLPTIEAKVNTQT